jgi:NAD(P)H dehydrogenase (quinone)
MTKKVALVTKEKVLIIGATGTIGEHVADQLATADQVEPIVCVRNAQGSVPFQARGIQTIAFDLSDRSSVAAAVKGIDSIFLLTGYTAKMLPQSKLVIDQAEAAGVKHIVHLGAWAPGDTDIEHFGWHQYVERYIEASNLGWAHVAPAMFMQNMLGANRFWRASMGPSPKGSQPIHAFFGEGALGWIAAEDIANVCALALQDRHRHVGKKYNLSVEVRLVQEIAKILEDTIEHPFHVVTPTPEQFHEELLMRGMEPTYAASALDTVKRFSANAIPGQQDICPFESITGCGPILWPTFARAHRHAFLGGREHEASPPPTFPVKGS